MSDKEDTNVTSLNLDKLKEIVKELDITKAEEFVDEIPNADIASLLEELSFDEQLEFLKLLDTSSAADIFSYLNREIQIELAKSFTEKWSMELLQKLQSDELVDILDELPANVTSKILAYTTPEKRSKLNKLLSYSDDEVGSIMNVDISIIPNTLTCEQALFKIRRDYKKDDKEIVHYYYVTDATHKLLGAITLEEILFAPENEIIDNLYEPVASVETNEKKINAATIFSEHDMSVLPVVNSEKRLVGIITSDDVIDVIQEEATIDMYSIVGINQKANDHEYSKMPWYKLVGSRLLWLSLLLILTTLVQIIIHWALKTTVKQFDSKNLGSVGIQLGISFASIAPVIIAETYNSGLQANISISRALVLNNITKKDYKRALSKEFLIGLILGLSLGIVNFARLGIYYSATKDLLSPEANKFWALIIGTSLALFISVLLSNFLGALFPLLLAKSKKKLSQYVSIILNTLTNTITALVLFGITYGILLSM